MLLKLYIYKILSNAVTLLDNRTFYYSRNISKLLNIMVIIILSSISIVNADILIFTELVYIIIIIIDTNFILTYKEFFPQIKNTINYYKILLAKSKYLCAAKNYSINTKEKITNNKLNPWWITGFVDAEGSFSISIVKNIERTIRWRIKLAFSITLHAKDIDLLNRIRDFFGVGNIYIYGDKASYKVDSRENLKNVIIPHFEKYSLITQKASDFILFKEILNLISNNKLTLELFQTILNLKASHNKGLTKELLDLFPETCAVPRPLVPSQDIKNPNWITGFTDGDGCFFVKISKSSQAKLGSKTSLDFNIRQHSRDVLLLSSLINFFKCGNIYETPGVAEFRVSKISDIQNIIIPFFKAYPLQSHKIQNFLDFILVSKMIENKENLTIKGLEKIKVIKTGMNAGREN